MSDINGLDHKQEHDRYQIHEGHIIIMMHLIVAKLQFIIH